MPTGVRIKLSAMMFLQFMMFAVFWIQLAPYLGTLKLGDMATFLMVSSMAIGCLFSPIIGMVADRYFAGQKVLFVMNLLGAVLLLLAAFQTDPTLLFIVLLLFMICYMPSWGLTSAIAMANSPPERFPHIRVFGSIGWVASMLFSLVAKWAYGEMIDSTNIPLFCGAAVGIVAAVVALTIPHTPPPAKGKPFSIVDALGLRSLVLMKDFSFALFIIVSLLVMLPFGMHWTFVGAFLKDKGFELITGTAYLGQVVEIVVMPFVAVAIARMGVKWAMSVGLVFLIVRFAGYMCGDMFNVMPLVYVGIMVHGLIYGFFFVGGQIYINRKAPKEIQAQAQGFIFLVTFGVGLLVANWINLRLIRALKTDETVGGVAMKDWTSIWIVMTVVSVAALVVFFLFFWDKPKGEEEKAEAEKAAA